MSPKKSSLATVQRELGLRGSLSDFIRMTWPLVEPGTTFSSNWHIDAIAEHLEAVTRGEIKRLVINIPPGCMKSLSVSVFWPVWEWLRDPSLRSIYASFDQSLTRMHAGKSLDLICSSWFTERWGDIFYVNPDSARGEYENNHKGWRFTTSIRGKVTGRHANRHVCDDPIKPNELSKNALAEVAEWWGGTMASRVADTATLARIVMMQRLHETDLAGLCIDSGDYEVLKIPMEYSKSISVATKIWSDPREEEGDLLWPARFSEGAVFQLKKDMGSRTYSAQYQQAPSPAGGAVFKRDWFHFYDTLPAKVDQWVQSWDCTFKGASTSDYVVGQVWARADNSYYLVDEVRQRLSFPETLDAIRTLSKKWPKATCRLIEDKANGPAVIQVLEKELSPKPIAINPQGGKESRANAVAPFFESGSIFYPKTMWVEDHIEELVTFPTAAHDDRVDAMSQAIVYMHEHRNSYMAAIRSMQSGDLHRTLGLPIPKKIT